MTDSDVVFGWVTPNGGMKMYDGLMPAYGPPTIVEPQNIIRRSANLFDGITTLNFSRAVDTGDNNDLQFTDCLYLLFPYDSAEYFEGSTDSISRHRRNPAVSDDKICIDTCRGWHGQDRSQSIEGAEGTTPTYDKAKYAVVFLLNEPWRKELSDTKAPEFAIYQNHVELNLEDELQEHSVSGMKDVKITGFENKNGRVQANAEVVIDDTGDNRRMFSEGMTDAGAEGRLGDLHVTSLLSLERVGYREQTNDVEENEKRAEKVEVAQSEKNASNLSRKEVVAYSVIGGVALLVIVAILLACCKYHREYQAKREAGMIINGTKDNSIYDNKRHADDNMAYQAFSMQDDYGRPKSSAPGSYYSGTKAGENTQL
ncbi:PREDICTED: uncharacterized protein LOC106805269 isoform X2 [Priapulus caudatus]|uniref:Uncharacterized protein LOC106805269 isoform X2 n=1 Tax=Priapulus caudatus TaxID=37621 RepID=A0ABM1DQR5_PRICU|nr:PREDICTED: uncharacterized protein LOC106805269 isoform X2 [Priapulus caudatus]